MPMIVDSMLTLIVWRLLIRRLGIVVCGLSVSHLSGVGVPLLRLRSQTPLYAYI